MWSAWNTHVTLRFNVTITMYLSKPSYVAWLLHIMLLHLWICFCMRIMLELIHLFDPIELDLLVKVYLHANCIIHSLSRVLWPSKFNFKSIIPSKAYEDKTKTFFSNAKHTKQNLWFRIICKSIRFCVSLPVTTHCPR